jgi:hypothetical protein
MKARGQHVDQEPADELVGGSVIEGGAVLHWEAGGLFALEDAASIGPDLAPCVGSAARRCSKTSGPRWNR